MSTLVTLSPSLRPREPAREGTLTVAFIAIAACVSLREPRHGGHGVREGRCRRGRGRARHGDQRSSHHSPAGHMRRDPAANERSRSRRHSGSPSARLGVTGAGGGAASAPRLQIVGRPGKDPVASPNRTRRPRQQTSARLPARLPVHRRVRATSGTGRYSRRVLRKTGNRSNTACRPRARPRTSAIPPAWVSQDCFERAITGICHTLNSYSRQRYPYAL
jgi:hypothetical protein